jgi:hypothetical protein
LLSFNNWIEKTSFGLISDIAVQTEGSLWVTWENIVFQPDFSRQIPIFHKIDTNSQVDKLASVALASFFDEVEASQKVRATGDIFRN